MKGVAQTPDSSAKSTATSNESELQDSSYFPGCRKDANCKCEICIASINATLDLMPRSIHRSSLTRLSAAKRPSPTNPISFDATSLSTPISSRTDSVSNSPPLNSTARTRFHERVKRKKREFGSGVFTVKLILALMFVFTAEFGFSWVVNGLLQPRLSMNVLRDLAAKSRAFKNLDDRMLFLGNQLKGLIDDDEVSICSFVNSTWNINQDGLLLYSRCTMFKSATEKVSIWGWPLQTSGLLTAELTSRSFTILSGRVTEWVDGGLSYFIRNANTSWELGKWRASAVQLDPNTWMLEYKQTSIIQNSRLISATFEFLKFRLTREIQKLKQDLWLLPRFDGQHVELARGISRVPT